MASQFLPCELHSCSNVSDSSYDCVLLVTHDIGQVAQCIATKELVKSIEDYIKIDSSISSGGVAVINCASIPSGRLVLSHTKSVSGDFDDVRRFSDAANDGMKRALSSGSTSPLLVTLPCTRFAQAELVSTLGALCALYVPLQNKEIKNIKFKATKLGLFCQDNKTLELATAFEAARCVMRDIFGSDPECMTPIRVAEYVQSAFEADSAVKIKVLGDRSEIEQEYPLMAAVNRACNTVPRHAARLIELEYTPKGDVDSTLMIVGKGVTIDTGGADLKTDGGMYGMSFDKGGAATVAGFFKLLDILRPKGLKVIGHMAMVRNSIGPEGYTCDEIIKARSGKLVRIVNTDAEGRLAMLDPLCKMKEMAISEVNPHLMTIATLTGHAERTVGAGYSISMDNGPALKNNFCYILLKTSEQIGDIIEVSRLRTEDLVFHASQDEYADLRNLNDSPEPSKTPRGHQSPAGFLMVGSGLDKHGLGAENELKYTHIDMASSEDPWPGLPVGRPLTALGAHFILPRLGMLRED